MVATSGDRLVAADAEAALRELAGEVGLVTPNLPELAVLVDEPVAADWPAAIEQGRKLSRACGVVVLVKGGHLSAEFSPDALVDATGQLNGTDEGVVEFVSPRVATRNTHGTGCSLSSAIATVMARTGNWAVAVSQAKDWLQDALIHADELQVGQGNGPINHFHRLWAAADTTTH
jgi:hydroxymethylpyrimidine kinase/phosphomethylpyrimidine kinase